MIVMKFGGTSVENAAAMLRVAEIVLSKKLLQPVVVLSAMGRTTDRLLEAAALAQQGSEERAREILDRLRRSHLEEASCCVEQFKGSPYEGALQDYFDELGTIAHGLSILGEMTGRTLDLVTSYGERLSTMIFAGVLKSRGHDCALLDSRQLIKTDSQFTRAAPDFEATQRLLEVSVPRRVEGGSIVVLQGFIGSNGSGITTTLGRGGSDYSAAIVGACLGADTIEIWTDVPGILTADPNLVPGARKIKRISFDEASELAYFGARVLHPSTLLPAIEKNIPVYVLNSRDPKSEGTLIRRDEPPGCGPVKSIAYKNNITIINIASTRMLGAHGFLQRIFEVFDRHRKSVDVVATSEVSVSVTVDDTFQLQGLVADLEKIGRVQVEQGKAIICLVGENIKYTPGIAAATFQAISDINVYMISEGASEINLTFVVDQDKVPKVVCSLHSRFFDNLDQPECFE